MGKSQQRDCTFFRAHQVSGITAYTGIQHSDGGQKITTTIYDPKLRQAQANFWADITKDSDIAEFLLIVSTYVPKTRDQR